MQSIWTNAIYSQQKKGSSDENDAARLHERHRGRKDEKILTVGEQMSMQCVWLANGEKTNKSGNTQTLFFVYALLERLRETDQKEEMQ